MIIKYNPANLRMQSSLYFGNTKIQKSEEQIQEEQTANKKRIFSYDSEYYLYENRKFKKSSNKKIPSKRLFPTEKDGFTNLKNKKCLLSDTKLMKLQAKREGKNLQIAMFDMDNFKSVNEILSYETGDVFIKRIAEIIKENTEKNQMEAYRFGGEEFIIMTTDENTEKIKEISTKIKNEIENDSLLGSYKVDYVSSLNTKLAVLEENNKVLQKVEKRRIELKILNELLNSDSSLIENAAFKEKYNKTTDELGIYTGTFIRLAEKYETKPEIKEWLEEQKTLLSSKDSLLTQTVYGNDKLYEYFDEKFNKRSNMYQIRKWLNDFNRNGFSITCGIADITKEAFDKQPDDLINIAGEILKSGKSTQKGEIYTKTVGE